MVRIKTVNESVNDMDEGTDRDQKPEKRADKELTIHFFPALPFFLLSICPFSKRPLGKDRRRKRKGREKLRSYLTVPQFVLGLCKIGLPFPSTSLFLIPNGR
jgi:hypothetical protein